MEKILTNPAISTVHAACFSREIHAARTLDELKEAAKRHGAYLLGSDHKRLQGEYVERLSRFKGLAHNPPQSPLVRGEVQP